MAVLPIRLYPDEVLRLECRPVERFDEGLRKLASDMVDTMHAAPGVGLAAPQVGVDLRLAVVDVTVGEEEEALIVLVNPQVVESAGEEIDVEGCLSIPELTDKVARPHSIVVQASDLDGSDFELEAEGFVARAICHEIDHLDGVLFVDRLHGLRRERARRHLRRLERDAVEAPA
jgi:peptide deformylase